MAELHASSRCEPHGVVRPAAMDKPHGSGFGRPGVEVRDRRAANPPYTRGSSLEFPSSRDEFPTRPRLDYQADGGPAGGDVRSFQVPHSRHHISHSPSGASRSRVSLVGHRWPLVVQESEVLVTVSRYRAATSSRLSGTTRTPATDDMKFRSPDHLGTTWTCRCWGSPAPAASP